MDEKRESVSMLKRQGPGVANRGDWPIPEQAIDALEGPAPISSVVVAAFDLLKHLQPDSIRTLRGEG